MPFRNLFFNSPGSSSSHNQTGMTAAWNSMIDLWFYDVGSLAAGLWAKQLEAWLACGGSDEASDLLARSLADCEKFYDLKEGDIFVVDPKAPRPFCFYTDIQAFLKDSTSGVKTIAVAGVGSSALGSAAFAWNVAQGLREPVAAIVAGQGMSDVVGEGLNGYFGLGLSAAMRPYLYKLLSQLGTPVPPEGVYIAGDAASDGDADVLHNLLSADDKGRITRLVGHSKGCLSIDAALQGIPEQRRQGMKLLNFCCAVSKPAGMKNVTQIVGLLDQLGQRNSWGNQPDMTPMCRHTTNPWMFAAMPVTYLTAFVKYRERP